MCSIAVASQVHEDDVYTLICQLRGNYNLPRDDFACVYTHYLKKPCIQSYVA